MQIVAFLSDLDRYRDRVLAWQAAAEAVGRMTLLTLTPPRTAFASPALHIEPLSRRPLRGLEALAALLRWWRGRRGVDVLHDAQGFLLPLFARVGRRGPVRLSSSFTFAWDWFDHLRGHYPVEWRVRELRSFAYVGLEWALARVTDAFTVFGEGHRGPCARAWRFPEERIFSMPNCVDPNGFSPEGPVGHTGFDPADPVLLFVGQVFRYKGVHELIEATATLRRDHPRLRLLLVGDVPPEAAGPVRAHLAQRGLTEHVRLPGPLPRRDLPGLLRAATVVVLPSYTEGSPRVLIEAMACGRPIVGTDLPGIAALDPTGQALPRVPRADAAALTRALAGLLADPVRQREVGRIHRARFLEHHTPAAAGRVLANLYRELAERRPP